MTSAVEGYNVQAGPAIPVYLVNVSAPAAAPSENALGTTGNASTKIDCIPTLTVHATYVTGDYVGESGASFSVPDVARIEGGSGFLKAVLIDYAKQSIAMELWVFDWQVTPPNDSAAWALSDADMARCVGVIPFNTYYASANNSISFNNADYIVFKCQPTSKRLWFCLVTRGSPAYASGDLTVRFFVWQD